MVTTKSKISVSGNIISELSEKIPNNIVALNELIKNAYDAGSSSVNIILDSSKNLLIIRDYGTGMDIKDINKLFHISASEKKYGKKVKVNNFERIVQGSKGLGFLSVFKFGKVVCWRTTKTETLKFEVNFDNIKSEYNITDHVLDVTHNESKDKEQGTEIRISVDEYNMSSLKDYFSDKKNLKKVLNSFINEYDEKGKTIIKTDIQFTINLTIDGANYSTDTNLDLEDIHKEAQFLRIQYNSKEEMIKFFYKKHLAYSKKFEFNSTKFSLNLDIQSYILKPRGKENVNSLFYNPSNEELTPLLFINNNLFNNYSIFNTGVMKPIKNTQVLSQMIGYVSVKSSDEHVRFNSDRTQFAQNELTDEIVSFIEKLNKTIQKTGSKIKQELKEEFLIRKIINAEEMRLTSNFNPKNFIKKGLILSDLINIELTKDKIIYKLFDNSSFIQIIPKQKKESKNTWTYYIGQNIDDVIVEFNNIIKNPQYISLDSEKKDYFNQKIPGEWTIRNEDDNQINITNIIVLQPEQPKISVKIQDIQLHRTYGYDELFSVVNSFGKEDQGIRFDLFTDNQPDINNQKRDGKISFGKVKEVTIKVKVTDKKTSLSHEIEAYFRVLDPSKEISHDYSQETFIRMPVSIANHLPQDIKAFIIELNKLSEDERYTYTFVSSVRTLIELCVIDILNLKEKEKKESLAQNYKLVLNFYDSFIEHITDKQEQQVIRNIYNSISSNEEIDSFLAFLNLSTHGSSRIIPKNAVKTKTREIGALLEFLNFLNKS
ncbi:ATP-binding protein [Gracilibacillus phocaeensis]|uniref:ATP-binding protein n=1 Tax=Gracilibacillus phocaeensis TaxID=2042304 RepID=UPI001A911CA9|nr:ATP-binding protein [Gracilibacillus phocaeensis]